MTTNLRLAASLELVTDCARELIVRLRFRRADAEASLDDEEQRMLIGLHEMLIEIIKDLCK
jgi:Na+/phosphate symporter